MSLSRYTKHLPDVQVIDVSKDTPAPGLYEVVNALFTKERIDRMEEMSPYMVLRVLSMAPGYLELSNIMSRYIGLERDLFYNVLRAILPEQEEFGRWRYLKPDKVDKIVPLVARHFLVNHRRAKDILAVLEHEGIKVKEVKSFFGREK